MEHSKSTLIGALTACALVFCVPAARAQAWHYPAFQPPVVSVREFNFAVAGGGDYGTTGLFQWREGLSPDTHLGFDFGFDSPSGGSTLVLLGGAIGQSLMHATQQTPIDLMLTGGIYGAFSSDYSVVRLPIGVSVGHRFPLQGGMALTPFAAPRLSIDVCASHCFGEGTNVNVNFDMGVDWDITSILALRGAFTVGAVGAGPSKTGFGLGLAFHPSGTLHR